MVRLISNRRGSASILVMLIMISLITFGLLAMMLSNSDYKMARKNANWVQQQYALESQAALAEAALDGLLTNVNEKHGSAESKEELFSAVGKGLKELGMKGYVWQWQAEKNLAVCQLSADEEGRSMLLGFQIRLASPTEGRRIQYDVVAWRIISR